MQAGEAIAIGGLEKEVEEKCPFSEEAEGADSEDPEDIEDDDSDAAEKEQKSSGGQLGKNLIAANNGSSGTVGGPYPPPAAQEDPRVDTRRSGVKVKVPGVDQGIGEGVYGFTLAAHHLIPGNASLAASSLKNLMTEGESVEVITTAGKKTKTVSKHIGYNVNGAHNGVWLPGNYYIRRSTSPIRNSSWKDLKDNPWCLHYVAAVSKAAGGQFHDAHTKYSEAVEELLNKIQAILVKHECSDCATDMINPPFQIKERLYNLSKYFKGQLTSEPTVWKRPWFASDRWRDHAFSGGKPSKSFSDMYREARVVRPSST